jgi:outer membrane protein assembly factor BamB
VVLHRRCRRRLLTGPVANGTIYVGSDDHSLYALNSDGSEKWSFLTGKVLAFCSPTVAKDGTIYVGSEDGNF